MNKVGDEYGRDFNNDRRLPIVGFGHHSESSVMQCVTSPSQVRRLYSADIEDVSQASGITALCQSLTLYLIVHSLNYPTLSLIRFAASVYVLRRSNTWLADLTRENMERHRRCLFNLGIAIAIYSTHPLFEILADPVDITSPTISDQ